MNSSRKTAILPHVHDELPMGYIREAQRDLRRRKTFTTSSISELVPLQSDWKGNGEPVIPLISRRGQLQFIDIFHNPSGGFSATVSAATGAGKSFFVNELIMSYLGIGSRVWVIDVGRSYEKLCSFVGGDFIVFERESKTCINPFSKIQDSGTSFPR
jgi:conjugal transfer ATP-binding protein TraC